MPAVSEVVAVVALLGTGGVIGSWLNEWRRTRREDRLRWQGDRRSTYERFVTAVDNVRDAELDSAELAAGLRATTGWGDDPLFDVEDLIRAAQGLEDPWSKYATERLHSHHQVATAATDQLSASLAAMEMVASPSVLQAATNVRNMLMAMVQVAYEYPPRHCGGWSEPLANAHTRLMDARRQFVKAVRNELGVA